MDIDGDQGYFPVFEQDESRVREIEKEYAEATKDPTKHYDASKDNRATGAGFFQFSGDEETRRRQMEELKRTREETEQKREEAGAFSPSSGLDGLDIATSSTNVISESAGSQFVAGRGMEKRKREIEERRKLLVAKRRKNNPSADTAVLDDPLPVPKPSSSTEAKSHPVDADDFLARLEADMLRQKSST